MQITFVENRLVPGTLSQRAANQRLLAAFRPAKGITQKFVAPSTRRAPQSVRSAKIAAAAAGPASTAEATRPMDIVFIATEVAPWSKTGEPSCLKLGGGKRKGSCCNPDLHF